MAELRLCAAFMAFADWITRAGIPSFADEPRIWSGRIGDYDVRYNGTREEVEAIPPFHFTASRGGFPALIGPSGGFVPLGVEDELIASFERATAAFEDGGD